MPQYASSRYSGINPRGYDPSLAEEEMARQAEANKAQLGRQAELGQINAGGISALGDAAAGAITGGVGGYYKGKAQGENSAAHARRMELSEEDLNQAKQEHAYWNAPSSEEEGAQSNYALKRKLEMDKLKAESAHLTAPKERKLEKVTETDANGNTTERFVYPTEGQSYVSKAKKNPEDAKPVLVTYEDPVTGEAVQSFETPVPGKKLPGKPIKDKETRGDQFKVATFAHRLEQAEDVFNDLTENQKYNRADKSTAIYNKLAPESFETENFKKNDQAERNFVNAVLRRESGSAISDSEFSNAEKQYFRRAGDTSDVIAQKKANRDQVIAGLKAEAGDAYNKVPRVPGVIAKTKTDDGTAIGAPKQKTAEEMTPEERKAELKRLRGK